MALKHVFPSGWGPTGATAPTDDTDVNTVNPSEYMAAHTGRWNRRLTANAATLAVTTWADISATDFSVPVEANKRYGFRAHLIHTTNATTTGARFGVNGPATPTYLRVGLWGFVTPISALTGTPIVAGGGTVSAYNTSPMGRDTGPGTVEAEAFLEGTIEVGATAGNLRLAFASEVAVAAGVTVLRGSSFEVWEYDN